MLQADYDRIPPIVKFLGRHPIMEAFYETNSCTMTFPSIHIFNLFDFITCVYSTLKTNKTVKISLHFEVFLKRQGKQTEKCSLIGVLLFSVTLVISFTLA